MRTSARPRGAARRLVIAAITLLVCVSAAAWLVRNSGRERPEAVVLRPLARAPSTEFDSSIDAQHVEEAARHDVPAGARAAQPAPLLARNDAVARGSPSTEIVARFVDATGRGLGNVELELEAPKRHARSDERGELRWTFDLPGDPWRAKLETKLAGFATRRLDVLVHAGGSVDLGTIELIGGGAVAGTIVGVNGIPAPGVDVLLAPLDAQSRDDAAPDSASVLLCGRTDAAGVFRLEGVPAGTVRLWARAERTAWARSGSVEVRVGFESSGIVLQLEPIPAERLLHGRVVDESGRGVAGALIECHGRSRLGSRGARKLHCDGAGRFAIEAASADWRYDLFVSAAAQRLAATALEDVRPGGAELSIVLRASQPLRLLLRGPDGAAPRECTVVIYATDGTRVIERVDAQPDAQGMLELAEPSIAFTLEVAAPGCAWSRFGPYAPSAHPRELELRLDALAGVRGSVIDADGRPCRGARVLAHALNTSSEPLLHDGFPSSVWPAVEAETRSDADGAFRLDLRNAGAWRVRAEADGLAPAESDLLEHDPLRALAPLRLVVGHGGSLRGRACDAAGRAQPGVIVTLSRGDGHPRSARCGSDGRFALDALAPGAWLARCAERDVDLDSWNASLAATPVPDTTALTIVADRETWLDLCAGEPSEGELVGRAALGGQPLRGWSARLVDARGAAIEVRELAAPAARLGESGAFAIPLRALGAARLVLAPPADASGCPLLWRDLVLVAGSQRCDADLAAGHIEWWRGVEVTPRALVSVARDDGWHALFIAPASASSALSVVAPFPAGDVELRTALDATSDPADWARSQSATVPADGSLTLRDP